MLSFHHKLFFFFVERENVYLMYNKQLVLPLSLKIQLSTETAVVIQTVSEPFHCFVRVQMHNM